MKSDCEMANDRNVSSVLAKLMGIDKVSTPCNTPLRHRVLSENYLQNIAFVAKRGKPLLCSDDVDYDMDGVEDSVECSEGVGAVVNRDFLCGSGQSVPAKRSFSSSYSSSGDRKRTKSLFERNSRVGLRERRMNGSCNSGNSPGSSLSSQEIAKQVAGQVMHSVWHSVAELSRSSSSTEKSSVIKEEVEMTSPAHLYDSMNNCETSSFNPVQESTSRITRKAKKQLLEKWKTRKNSRDEVLVTSSGGNRSTAFSSTTGKEWPVRAGRYLSKSALFPSAWVPRSRARDFTLDKNWCLKPEKRDSKLCSDTKEDSSGHKDVQSTSESSICSCHLEKPCIRQEVSLIFNDSLKENSSEGVNTVTKGHVNHEAHKIWKENGCGHLEKDVSQDRNVECLFLNCSLAPLNLETSEVTDEDVKNKNMSTKLWRENLSAQQTACILLSDKESWKAQSRIKNNVSEPGSPVSSLEGPEACRQVLNFNVEAEEQLAALDSLENNTHGLQTKFQLIENLSLESGSEGPGMMVSSEEGDDGGSVGWNPKDPQIMEISQTLIKECYDFSYIVDVLVESGIYMRNLEMECKTWFLQGYALEPFVFDMLEKKYGKQLPWEKSERKLLFDCINSGLLEMVKPSIGLSSWRKPVAKRFSRRQESSTLIEDELWWLLVNQQEGVEKESNDKLKYIIENERLGLEEETSLIAQEIQSSLMDELVEELCMEVCFC